MQNIEENTTTFAEISSSPPICCAIEKLEIAIGPPKVMSMQASASPVNPRNTAHTTAISGIKTSLAKTVTAVSLKQPFILPKVKLPPIATSARGGAIFDTSLTDFSIT